MSRTILLTGPELAAEAMHLAAEQGVRIVPTTPYLPSEELEAIIRAEQPDAIVVRQGNLTRAMIEASDKLKVIAKHGVGYNTIDIQAAADRCIPVWPGLDRGHPHGPGGAAAHEGQGVRPIPQATARTPASRT